MRQIYYATAFLLATLNIAAAQNVFFPANPGDMIVKGTVGAWAPVPGGTAGCALISNGPTAAPTWQCALPLNFHLPPMAVNTLWCNVSGAQAPATACSVSQILNTIDYDIQRPPLAGSIPYVGTDSLWHLAPPPAPAGWVWTSQGTGQVPRWVTPGGYVQPGAAGTCLVSNGPLVAPSYTTCPSPGTFVASVFGRTGAVSAQNGDYNISQITGSYNISQITGPLGAGLRITLTPGTPVMSSDVVGAAIHYCTSYPSASVPGYVPVYNGTNFTPSAMGGELSQATTDATKSPAAVTTDANYDIFYWLDAGTPRCTRGPPWNTGGGSDTTRGNGAGSTELTLISGVYVNGWNITNGPLAQRGTYVGTIRSNGTSTIDMKFGTLAANGGAASFGVWNVWNRVRVTARIGDTTANWSLASPSIQAAHSSTTMRASFIVGLQEDAYTASYQSGAKTAAGGIASVGVAFNSITAFCAGSIGSLYDFSSGSLLTIRGECSGTFLGFNYAQAVEASQTAGTQTFIGNGGTPTYQQNMLMLIGKY